MVVLVTGCRSGFGLGAAVEIAKRGHTVYAGLRDLSTAGELRAAAEGLDVRPVQLDVTNAEQRAKVVADIVSEHGGIDGLVNNAGIALAGFVETVSEAELRRLMEVNFFGLWGLQKEVLPHMRAKRSGTIVNISSMSGRMAFPTLGLYAASKFAVEGMSEAMSHELAQFGIRVVLIEPAAYKTDIWGRNKNVSASLDDLPTDYQSMADKLMAIMGKAASMGGDPREVVEKIADCLEDRAPALRYVMGPGSSLRLAARTFLPQRVFHKLLRKQITPKAEA